MNGNRCSSDQKKIVHIKLVWIGSNHKKAVTCYSENSLFWKCSQQQKTRFFQLPTYPTTREFSHQYLLMIKTQCSILSKFHSISFLHESMYKYNKNQDSPYDPTKLAIHSLLRAEADSKSNCAHISKKTVSFDDIVNFIVEENILTYIDFDCGFTFNPETPTKIREINRTRNYISISCKKPECIPSSDQHNCSFDKQHTSNISLNRYSSWNLVLTFFVSLNHTNDRDCISKH